MIIKGTHLAAAAALVLSSPIAGQLPQRSPRPQRSHEYYQKVIAEARERRRVQEAKDAAFRENAMAAAEAKRERKRIRRAKALALCPCTCLLSPVPIADRGDLMEPGPSMEDVGEWTDPLPVEQCKGHDDE